MMRSHDVDLSLCKALSSLKYRSVSPHKSADEFACGSEVASSRGEALPTGLVPAASAGATAATCTTCGTLGEAIIAGTPLRCSAAGSGARKDDETLAALTWESR
mmetsp:Transcript_44679/g.104098  ORF Transcript_44679/g.104098 Transcript_44679/m.104098 type:complete len:104 (-) Transcript_44679:1260-1571(-)